MTQSWEKRVKVPTLKQLEAKAAARLKFLEDDLHKHGYFLVVSAEQEFLARDATGGRAPVHMLDVLRKPGVWRQLQKAAPLLESTHEEEPLGTGELSLSTLNTSCAYPSVEIAKQTQQLRKVLPGILQKADKKIAVVSFDPVDDKPTATAGLHFNLSVQNLRGDNLFYDAKGTDRFSGLCDRSADNLLELQKQGTLLYAPQPLYYERFGRQGTAPDEYAITTEPGGNSITLKSTAREKGYAAEMNAREKKDAVFYRIEDRLAGAGASPCLVLLAGVGAIWKAALHPQAGPVAKKPPVMIMGDYETPQEAHARAQTTFAQSDLWRQIMGEDLYEDIIAYFRAQSQVQGMRP